uniref:Uncharacterized protein n=1 Tax=Coccolithus braarudii TaxID=221442 RepID=A0A7S0L755_9EUKA|mmetsp:Transcript_18785/g.40500  ORF Transcript_18785/g.40500 Transcript_18785/m.40500 type:complete len:365 (+) Transcript_18785:65-1159(+)|eukprot:CAMPEP_0183336636 /NCGR_PEP_ID=MMETSP0164_2-20130417/4559_1 /TAXON_ID=221442 /ORGANISM="Coccolithus pelagicus ssp braarudi, Strain PLY182g" /LENGTH=364 /DNA_ID=CAMNT_0025506203 /DNA_START=108 /DNA_END=1202 /DNA_ORIENTATION=-
MLESRTSAHDNASASGFRLSAARVAAVLCIGDSWLSGYNAAALGGASASGDILAFLRGNSFQVGDLEERGASFGCGDGKLHSVNGQVQTIATLLRRASPALQGLSRGLTPRGGTILTHPLQSGLNAAICASSLTGSRSPSFLSQAGMLVGVVQQGRYSHLATQWKVLTVQPGLAELAWGTRDPEIFTNQLRVLLGYLRSQLPFTYVNVMAIPENAEDLLVLQKESESSCGSRMSYYALHLRVAGAAPHTEGANQTASMLNTRSRQVAAEVMDTPRFMVRYQPVTTQFPFNKNTLDPLACLHPTAAMHQGLAYGLLQNMITGPYAGRSSKLHGVEDLIGTSERPLVANMLASMFPSNLSSGFILQ